MSWVTTTSAECVMTFYLQQSSRWTDAVTIVMIQGGVFPNKDGSVIFFFPAEEIPILRALVDAVVPALSTNFHEFVFLRVVCCLTLRPRA